MTIRERGVHQSRGKLSVCLSLDVPIDMHAFCSEETATHYRGQRQRIGDAIAEPRIEHALAVVLRALRTRDAQHISGKSGSRSTEAVSGVMYTTTAMRYHGAMQSHHVQRQF